MNKPDVIVVSRQLREAWQPAFEAQLGAERFAQMSTMRQNLCIAIANEALMAQPGMESMVSGPDNTTLAMNVLNPLAGDPAQGGAVSQPGTKGSGDRQFLLGICVDLAAKTVGLDTLQTIPVTSQNPTIDYLKVIYNGGSVMNAANNRTHVVTLGFAAAPTLVAGAKYVVGHATATKGKWEFMEATFIKADRKGPKYFIFDLGQAFEATKSDLAISNIAYLSQKPAIGALATEGTLFAINAEMTTLSAPAAIASCENTNAVENHVGHFTTKGLRRQLTRSEADAGTDRNLELDLESQAFVVRNRTMTANISRLQYKRLEEKGVATIPYLTAVSKNEFSQDINYDILSAERSYGLTTALEWLQQGLCFNTYIGPESVASIPFANLPYANELVDKDGNAVAASFPAIKNLMQTMKHETIASIGEYICMLISQVAYAIGNDSRFGEGDAVVLPSGLAGYVTACSKFTALAGKNVDLTNGTGAKLSGYINDIKVYVDVTIPANTPFITVLRTNQNAKVDVPNLSGDEVILVPGLAYLVKDLISSTEVVPSDTGGKKLIFDSETDIVAVGERAHAAYCTFAVMVNLPGLAMA